MEQRQLGLHLPISRALTTLGRCTLALVLVFAFVACKQPLENPEQADPIYQDLTGEQKSSETQLAAEKKTLADLEKSLREMAPHDVTKGQTVRAIHTQNVKVTTLEQQATYYKVRAEQRKAWDAKEYQRRFDADLPWPDQKEAAEYREMKKLRTTSLNWSDRVPKSTRYSKNPQPEGKPKAKEGGEHGGGHEE